MREENKETSVNGQGETVEPEIVSDGGSVKSVPGLKAIFRTTAGALIWRGVVMLIFSILLLIAPVRSIMTLTMVIGAFLVAGGLLAFFTAFRSAAEGRELMIFNAAALTLLGLFSVVFPGKADVFWVMVVGFYQIFSGVQALFCRGSRTGIVWISSAVSIIAGVVLVTAPWAGLMALTWLLALLLFAASLLTVVTGIKLRGVSREI